MTRLFQSGVIEAGPVECLGQTFPNEDARREHYRERLAAKLLDPEFKKLDGFPIGSDDAILALSDPPYFTACPNPFLDEFVCKHCVPYDPTHPYSREPFATDVSEGKNDPIYNAHSYHTKVPHKAIMRYILHYTEPGDLVWDGFSGTGMTGVAAQLCGDRDTVRSLGYTVGPDGAIKLQDVDEQGRSTWIDFSRLGARRAVLNDISPLASLIANSYNAQVDVDDFESKAKKVIDFAQQELGWMYHTYHTDGKTAGTINYTVWSDVFTCPECSGEIIFWNSAIDIESKTVRETFSCPHCSKNELSKKNLNRAWTTIYDAVLNETVTVAQRVPVLINYNVLGKRAEKAPDEQDLALIAKIESASLEYHVPIDRMIEGSEARRNDPIGATHVHHYFTKRNLAVLAAMWDKVKDPLMKMVLLDGFTVTTVMSRFRVPAWFDKSTGPMKGWTSGTLYVPSLQGEQNWMNVFSEKVNMVARALRAMSYPSRPLVSCSHLPSMEIPNNSIDYIFLDPPFGANLSYLRNEQGSTAIATFSTRARPGVPVAVPLDWKELECPVRPLFHVSDFSAWCKRLRRDPWKGMLVPQRLTAEILAVYGVKP